MKQDFRFQRIKIRILQVDSVAEPGKQDLHAEEVVGQEHHLAEEAHETGQPYQNEAAQAGDHGKAVEVIPVTLVNRFCSNQEFDGNILRVTLLRRTLRSV